MTAPVPMRRREGARPALVGAAWAIRRAVAWAALAAVPMSFAACKRDEPPAPAPVELTAESLGHYCQMALLDHEGPKAQIHLDGALAPAFFGQVSDAVAYLRSPEREGDVAATYVQDMSGGADWTNPGPWIDAGSARYVVGSSRLGGMGAPEFVPFSDETAARAFALAHGGSVRSLGEISEGDLAVAALLATFGTPPQDEPDNSGRAANFDSPVAAQSRSGDSGALPLQGDGDDIARRLGRLSGANPNPDAAVLESIPNGPTARREADEPGVLGGFEIPAKPDEGQSELEGLD